MVLYGMVWLPTCSVLVLDSLYYMEVNSSNSTVVFFCILLLSYDEQGDKRQSPAGVWWLVVVVDVTVNRPFKLKTSIMK